MQHNKTMLAKGLAQTIGGTYCTLATMFSLAYKGKLGEKIEKDVEFDGNILNFVFEKMPEYNDTFMYTLALKLLSSNITFPITYPQKVCNGIGYRHGEKCGALSNIIITPLTAYIAYRSLSSGIQNCKQGWYYKASLEQQIRNIDKMSEYIQRELRSFE